MDPKIFTNCFSKLANLDSGDEDLSPPRRTSLSSSSFSLGDVSMRTASSTAGSVAGQNLASSQEGMQNLATPSYSARSKELLTPTGRPIFTKPLDQKPPTLPLPKLTAPPLFGFAATPGKITFIGLTGIILNRKGRS